MALDQNATSIQVASMLDWFWALEQPQATVLSAVITFLGAIAAVLLGWMLFRSKVRDMRSAISATDELLRQHQTSVLNSLSDIEARVSSLGESFGQVRADIVDRQDEGLSDEVEEKVEAVAADGLARDPALFEDVQKNWHQVRDVLEEIAADPGIDGRTAAKYQRIDRRNYIDLINSLTRDNRLPNPQVFADAASIWSRYRTRRMAPNPEDAKRIADLAASVAPAQ